MPAFLFPLLLAFAVTPEQAEFFEKKVRPVLASKCYDCHGPALSKPMGGLRLSSKADTVKGGDSGPAIGTSIETSRLIRAISYQDPTLLMPPRGKLSDAEIADLTAWVKMGAPDPRVDLPSHSPTAITKSIDYERARKWWSFQPLKVPSNTPASGYIDAFLLNKLHAKGLQYAPPADRRTLIRRLSLDLTGLPPSPEQVALFLHDRAPNAYLRLVDRMLSSPHYGERWARHWLDLVRFAETDGHEFDVEKPNAWRYRDYVIRAFNDDLPYDQFVKEQIAGDLLPNARAEAPQGTAMHFLGEVINSPVDPLQSHADRVDNQIDVFGKTFLGLTLGCARCHDHKFDPVPTSDYYALAGTFYSTRRRQTMVNSPLEKAAMQTIVTAAALRIGEPVPSGPDEELPKGYRLFEDFNDPAMPGWSSTGFAFHKATSGGIVDSARLHAALEGKLISDEVKLVERFVHVRLRGSGLVRLLVDEYNNKDRVLSGDLGKGFVWKKFDVRMGQGSFAYFVLEDTDPLGGIAVDRIVFSENPDPPDHRDAGPAISYRTGDAQLPPGAYALTGWDNNPHNAQINIRGNPTNLGTIVPRGFLSVFAGTNQPIAIGSGRLELAETLFITAKPLLARVVVNRIWKHHFGNGLVPTTDNFGLSGDRPSHPELLDTLAQRFVEGGWSIKKLHREILLSRAYQMASIQNHLAETADPDNKLLHRFPIRRLEVEALRDSMLAVTKSLDRQLYGPSILPWLSPFMDGDPRSKPKPGPIDGLNRRSIYINVRRNYISDMFQTFDYPQPIATIGRRNVSTVASQALYMMNGEFVAVLARRWATQTASMPGTIAERISGMYQEAFGRSPTDEEIRLGVNFIQTHNQGWPDYAQVLLSATELAYVR